MKYLLVANVFLTTIVLNNMDATNNIWAFIIGFGFSEEKKLNLPRILFMCGQIERIIFIRLTTSIKYVNDTPSKDQNQ